MVSSRLRLQSHKGILDVMGLSSTTFELKSTTIPEKCHDCIDVFSEEIANTLTKHSNANHHITLLEGAQPPFDPICPLAQDELIALYDYLKESLEFGFIRHSTSPAAAPILFVKKGNGSLRLCVDYRGLNKITIKNRYPLPLIGEIMNRLSTTKVYTKFDVRIAYHRFRIAEGDEWKTTFRTEY
ncbi:Putative Retrotransposon nucleocapsid protein [Rhizopus microsporus]|nr:Putative Retrotransposon nucleocapsid protein [Rhizopus microsporus]